MFFSQCKLKNPKNFNILLRNFADRTNKKIFPETNFREKHNTNCNHANYGKKVWMRKPKYFENRNQPRKSFITKTTTRTREIGDDS